MGDHDHYDNGAKKRFAYYLTCTKTEAIAITKRGRVIAYLVSPKEERLALIDS